MEKVYLTLIFAGKKKYSQVPKSVQVKVKNLLQKMVDNKEISKSEMKQILAA